MSMRVWSRSALWSEDISITEALPGFRAGDGVGYVRDGRRWRRGPPPCCRGAGRAEAELLKSHAGQVEAAPKPVSGPRYQEDVADVVAHQRAVLLSDETVVVLVGRDGCASLDLG